MLYIKWLQIIMGKDVPQTLSQRYSSVRRGDGRSFVPLRVMLQLLCSIHVHLHFRSVNHITVRCHTQSRPTTVYVEMFAVDRFLSILQVSMHLQKFGL